MSTEEALTANESEYMGSATAIGYFAGDFVYLLPSLYGVWGLGPNPTMYGKSDKTLRKNKIKK